MNKTTFLCYIMYDWWHKQNFMYILYTFRFPWSFYLFIYNYFTMAFIF